MTASTILAIDLGKYKCVACEYDRATASAEYRTVPTSRAEVERLVRAARPAVVVIEACSLAGWVHDLCGEFGVPCKVASGKSPRRRSCLSSRIRALAIPRPRCSSPTASGSGAAMTASRPRRGPAVKRAVAAADAVPR
jgi:hypothetical protein